MENFNYDATAELYPTRRYAKSQQAQYRRFNSAADAIRYAIEEMPAKWLTGTHLEVEEKRFEGNSIRALYDAANYPLPRMKDAA
jgi:Arc/MetJ-type ribon-helix-helix transcriptional regulator